MIRTHAETTSFFVADDSWRYEVKSIMPMDKMHSLLALLLMHDFSFYQAYPERMVNNIYFDTESYQCFSENMEGGAKRHKVRLRWYGPHTEKVTPNLEVKYKNNRHGKKLTYKASSPLDIVHGLPIQQLFKDLKKAFSESEEAKLFLDMHSQVAMVNSYRRQYYESFDRKIRVTFDFDQAFYAQWMNRQLNLKAHSNHPDYFLIEIKANEEGRNYLEKLLHDLKIRPSRHSKYVLGLNSTFFGHS